MNYLNIIFVLLIATLPVQGFCSEMTPAEYSVSTVFNGTIGRSKITIYLTVAENTVIGRYVYNKYGKEIFISGNKNENGFILREKLIKGSASINLTKNKDGYTGAWCNGDCLPINISSSTTFRNGVIKTVNSKLTDNGGYTLEVISTTGKVNIAGDNAVDNPAMIFSDINDDGIYDLIVFTDRRPNNGSQDVYLSMGNGYVKDKFLSSENGTLVFNPFKHLIVFNSKEDCCDKYKKIIYELRRDKYIKVDTLMYDYSKSIEGNNVESGTPKEEFEKY